MKLATLESANRWLNDPRILPFHHTEPLDLAPIWGECVVFEFDTGTVGFYREDTGCWQTHLCLVPRAGNGVWLFRMALCEIFKRDDCGTVIGLIHDWNELAARTARIVGFEESGSIGRFRRFVLERHKFMEKN